jgi:hypothetical protein
MGELRILVADREDEEDETNDIVSLKKKLLEHKVRERNAISKLRELELEHESGRFVELAVVRRDGEDAAERVLAILRAMPQRVALALECSCRRAAVVERVISEEVERAIAEMRASMYVKPRAK